MRNTIKILDKNHNGLTTIVLSGDRLQGVDGLISPDDT